MSIGPITAQYDPWHWNWTYVCPTGLTPWLPHSNDLAPCFQIIFIKLPILTIFAILSGYYCGQRKQFVLRNAVQMRLLYVRILATLILSLFPFFELFYTIKSQLKIWPVDVWVGCTEIFTYFVHVVFLLSLRRSGPLNHRGPLCIGVTWSVIFLTTAIWLRTHEARNFLPWSIVTICMHTVYAITLLPNGESRLNNVRSADNDERRSLLGNTYIRFQDDVDQYALGHAQDGANIFSKLVFYWVNPLIEKGISGYLNRIDDLFDLPETLHILRITEHFKHSCECTVSLFRALHKSFGREFYFIGILRLIADMSGFAGPLLLGGLLREGSSDIDGTDYRPYLYALGLFSTTLLSAMCGTHFNWRMSLITMKMRMGIVTAIYGKSLEARSLTDARPDILNLMSTDTDRIVNSCISFHSFWSIPFQLFTTLYLLYTQIGAAFIAGVLFAIALIPINRWIAVKIGIYSQNLMQAKDARVASSAEALAGAKQIKLLAWEDVFIDKIQAHRRTEIKFLSKRKYLDALCVYFWATTPVLMCLLTFGVSVMLGNPLTASTTFASVALLNMLIGPLNTFPWVLNGLIEAWISLKRVQELIDLPNIDLRNYYAPLLAMEEPRGQKNQQTFNQKPIILKLKNATFEFDKQRNRDAIDLNNDEIIDFKLNSINLEIKKGDLICLEGAVGAGKSCLLTAILAELNCCDGMIYVDDVDQGFGYVAQSPWLQRGTIRENIVWGAVYDEIFYKKVLYACALEEDIVTLGGDHVGVGEGGRTLSGGQKARVALARAVYQDKEIYLLDDVLSALDTHVASHIIKYCLLDLLKTKTRIVVTENRTLFFYANQILHINNGSVSMSDEVVNGSFDIEHTDDDDNGMFMRKDSKNMSTMLQNVHNDNNKDDSRSVDSVMLEETKEHGTISPSVLASYWRSTGGWLSFTVIFSVIMMQATRNLSDAWLANWVTDNDLKNNTNISIILGTTAPNETHTTNFYLSIYASIAITNSVITLIRAFIFAYAGIKAAKFIHNKLLNRVFFTKFKFFDITPLGRILNRFSSDTYTIDDSLPFILNILLAQLAGLIGALCISLYAMPWLALLMVPLCPIYLNLQNQYRHSSRDIKRLSSNALSPLYAHFTETLQGLSTIRAMQATKRFKRDFLTKLEESLRAQLTASAAQQWLSIRLQFFGAILVGGAGLIAAITSAHASSPGMVGLAISYALSITGLLGGVLSALAETEQEFIAIERVDKYCELDEEVNADGTVNPPFGWPCQGIVSFKNAYLQYRENLSPALNDINLETAACERIGIVGRTGAGKSSMLSALVRVSPLSQGHITIDCVDIATLPLNVLRSRIALVPQDSFLFSGTIRENMDPRGLHLDSQIWNAISNCLATPLVQSLGGLNAQLDANGSNLSAGQKQLLCLARALLKNSKIVCIDEGTANLDSDSEIAIQLILKNAFKSSTVILIAHRLNSLQQTDRILVMDSGRIVEQGASDALSTDTASIFHSMLQNQRIRNFNQQNDLNDELL